MDGNGWKPVLNIYIYIYGADEGVRDSSAFLNGSH
jgi:hypothetical protein